MTQDGQCKKDVRSRISQAKRSFLNTKTINKTFQLQPQEKNCDDCHLEHTTIWRGVVDTEKRW